jgi:hypothetical protein
MKFYFFYKIFFETNINCYVGCTTNYELRMAVHRSNAINNNSNKLYQIINSSGGWDAVKMILLETNEYDNTLEAHQRERQLIELHKANLNISIPSRDLYEYRKTYHDKLTERLKSKIECSICNCKISYRNFQTHNKSKKHKNNIK